MNGKTYWARAPVRVDPAGGGTDAPPFCDEHGGAVVNFGIRAYAYASVQPDPASRRVRIVSADFGCDVQAESVDALAIDGELDLLKGIVKRLGPSWGFTLTVRSEVQPGSGLGSSGAVGVACVAVFDAALGVRRSPYDTALLANAIERDDLGMAGGSQDSLGAAFGGMNLLTYHKGGGVSQRYLAVPRRARYELERRCLLVYAGEVHLSDSIHEDIKRSYALPNSPTVDAMENLARVARASAEALEAGDVTRFGRLLNENRHHHKRLHASCETEGLRRYYDATSGLVVGGKTGGAGGGGYVLFLCEEGRWRATESVCRELGGEAMPLRVDDHGVTAW